MTSIMWPVTRDHIARSDLFIWVCCFFSRIFPLKFHLGLLILNLRESIVIPCSSNVMNCINANTAEKFVNFPKMFSMQQSKKLYFVNYLRIFQTLNSQKIGLNIFDTCSPKAFFRRSSRIFECLSLACDSPYFQSAIVNNNILEIVLVPNQLYHLKIKHRETVFLLVRLDKFLWTTIICHFLPDFWTDFSFPRNFQ